MKRVRYLEIINLCGSCDHGNCWNNSEKFEKEIEERIDAWVLYLGPNCPSDTSNKILKLKTNVYSF